MKTYNNSIVIQFDTSANGNAGAGKPVTVFGEGTETKAQLYDLDSNPISNPVFADKTGNYTFNVDSGVYDIYIDYGLITQTAILNESIVDSTGSTISETPPQFPLDGERWTRCTDMKGFIWYDDGESAQWVEDRPSYNSDSIGSTVSETPPPLPLDGERWTRCTDMKGFIWYIDDTSAQWIEDRPSYGTDTIGDLSQAYIFDTVAEYKASTIVFPVGKTIHLNDRGADFTVIAGTGTANSLNIIASDEVVQSIDLVMLNSIGVRQFGIVGDGVTDESDAIEFIISTVSDHKVNLQGLVVAMSRRIDFSSNNTWSNGTFLYIGASTDKLCVFSGENTFDNVIFDGNELQVLGGLTAILDNAKFTGLNCTWTRVKGILTGGPATLRNNQSGLIIEPTGANVYLRGCSFENIRNDNSGTYATPTIGYGFCSGILFCSENIVTTGDNTANPTELVAHKTSFKNIQTILAAGLTTDQQFQFNDADGIRAIGNTDKTTINAIFHDSRFEDVSKRAIKVASVRGMRFKGVRIYDRTLTYSMVSAVRPPFEGVVEDVKIFSVGARPVRIVLEIKDTDGLTIRNVWSNRCDGAIQYLPEASGMHNLLIEDFTCELALVEGVTISLLPAAVSNQQFRNIDINCLSNGTLGFEIPSVGNEVDAIVDGLKITNGDIVLKYGSLDARNVTCVIDNPLYESRSTPASPMQLGNANGVLTSTYHNINVNIKDAVSGYATAARAGFLSIDGSNIEASKITISVKDTLDRVHPHFVVVGDDINLDGLIYDGIGYGNISPIASERISVTNSTRKRGIATTARFFEVSNGADCVINNTYDYADTSATSIRSQGAGYVIINDVFSKTANAQVATVVGGIVINAIKFL